MDGIKIPCRHNDGPRQDCHWCDLARSSPRHQAAWGVPSSWFSVNEVLPTLPRVELSRCVHIGKPIQTNQASGRQTFECDRGRGVVCPCNECRNCSEFAMAEPSRMVRIDSMRLAGRGRKFNPSIIRDGDRWHMAYRSDWTNSRIHIATLDRQWNVIRNRDLIIDHPMCRLNQEDPRFFFHNGIPHLSFTAVENVRSTLRVHVMVAELADFEVKRVWYPHYSLRDGIEKNWVFFDCQNQLYCIYATVKEHQILKVGDVAEHAFSMPFRSIWTRGVIRGGASPVLVGNEYWHWFHAVNNVSGQFHYSTGVLTFENKPPFRVRRMTRYPVWTPTTRQKILKNKDVIFPCGAVLHGGNWHISAGHQDMECLVGVFEHAEIETLLEQV